MVSSPLCESLGSSGCSSVLFPACHFWYHLPPPPPFKEHHQAGEAKLHFLKMAFSQAERASCVWDSPFAARASLGAGRVEKRSVSTFERQWLGSFALFSSAGTCTQSHDGTDLAGAVS